MWHYGNVYVCCMLVIMLVATSAHTRYNFVVNVDKTVANLNNFWASTGFCPPLPHQQSSKYFLNESEVQNLIWIGSVPHGGIQQVRVHWLLDLVHLSFDNSTGQISFNFDLLDQLIERLWSTGLRPGFELMGNPSDWFTDFEKDFQVYVWRDMVTVLAKRYMDRYGLDYVATWNFESWNEPDHKDFDDLHFTVQGFLNYYDACSEGLRAASPKLRFGGPAGACRDNLSSVICWAVLQHCENGINYFTGEKGVRIDFISFHHKGKGHSMYILDTEIQTIDLIHRKYPRLAGVPIFNDEADPLVGWSKPEEWRADATYAAVVVKIIAQHQNLLVKRRPGMNYALLSNDNGFLDFNPNFFTQRTLVARFQMNKTHPPSIQTVKKPVLSVMGLLALLGDEQVQVFVPDTINNDSDVGILASAHKPSTGSHDSWHGSIIIYNSNDTSNLTGADNVRLTVKGVPSTLPDVVYVIYLVDNAHGNPYRLWKTFDKPVYPTRKQFWQIRQHQDPVRIEGPVLVTSSQLTLKFSLRKPGVLLIHVCARPTDKPPQVQDLQLHAVTQSDVLLYWDDVPSRCLLTYQVEYSAVDEQGPYMQINDVDFIFTSYLYSIDICDRVSSNVSTKGWYRVSAVDYWNRPGDFSVPVQLK